MNFVSNQKRCCVFTRNLILTALLLVFIFGISPPVLNVFAQENEVSGVGELMHRVNEETGFDPSQEERAFQVEVAGYVFTRKGIEPPQFHDNLVILEKAPYHRRALLASTLDGILNSKLYKSVKRSAYHERDNKLLIKSLQSELLGDNITAAYLNADRINLANRQNQKIKKVGDLHLDRVRNLSRAGEYDEAVRLILKYHPLATIRFKIWMNDILADIPDEFLKFRGNTVTGNLVEMSRELGPEKYIKFRIRTSNGKDVKFLANKIETVCIGKKIADFEKGDKIKAVVKNYFAKMVKAENNNDSKNSKSGQINNNGESTGKPENKNPETENDKNP